VNNKILIIGAVVILFAAVGLGIKATGKKETPVQQVSLPAENTVESQDISARQLHQEARRLTEQGDLLQAKVIYKNILADHFDYQDIESVQGELERINMEIIFSNKPTSQTVTHEVVSGDTLGKLAKKYGTTIELIKINNHLKSDIIRIGQRLRVWTSAFNIHVDKSQNILILKEGDDVVKVYNVSTGEDNSTPVGEYDITSKLIEPVWFNRGVVVPPDSPANVLGSRWLGFDLPGYGIHGTVNPQTIGQQVTAGCVRMRNDEVEELFSLIPTGTKVVIVD